MINTLKRLEKEKTISPPDWLLDNCMYLTMMGSVAYGIEQSSSDVDIYGWSVPPISDTFPHVSGLIHGFDEHKSFQQFQQHHINDRNALAGKGRELDLTLYSIVNYFKLTLGCNPNMINSIFTPVDCVLHCTPTGLLVRDNRHLFLHKGLWATFRGYATSQVHKMTSQNRTGKRKEVVDEYGFDLKFAAHTIRLLNEAEQLLLTEDLDLRRDREMLKEIRRGEWSVERVKDYFERKSKSLDVAFENSTLPNKPRRNEVRQLLYNCLEHHYGNLSNVMLPASADRDALLEIRRILDRNNV
jgi:uncharacterized protein